jgi:hypothetical protein
MVIADANNDGNKNNNSKEEVGYKFQGSVCGNLGSMAMQIQYLSRDNHHSRIIIIISQDLVHKGAKKLFINLFTIPILASISMELRD